MTTWRNGTYMEKSMRTKKLDDKHYIIKYNKVEEQNKRKRRRGKKKEKIK